MIDALCCMLRGRNDLAEQLRSGSMAYEEMARGDDGGNLCLSQAGSVCSVGRRPL